jgi:hypothetical protein
MKRYGFVITIALLLAIGAIAAAPAYAKAISYFKGLFETFNKQGTVLEIRTLKDGSYDVVYLTKEDKIRMLKTFKGSNVEQTPLKTYNIEKIKALGGGASKAFDVLSADPSFGKKSPAILCIEMREAKDGTTQFGCGAYMPSDGSWRNKLWVIDSKTWKMNPKSEECPDPRLVPWSVEEQKAGNNEYPKDAIGKKAGSNNASAESTPADNKTEAVKAASGEEGAPAAGKQKAKGMKGKGKGKGKAAKAPAEG